MAVTSADLIERDWTAAQAARARAERCVAHIERLPSETAPLGAPATVIDGQPMTAPWLGEVIGHRVAPLGLLRLGHSADIQDLYRGYYRDSEAIWGVAATALAGVAA